MHPTAPVKVYNASLLVGYPSSNEQFGINNILVSGNVGIGIKSPTAKLHVDGPLDGSASTIKIGSSSAGNINVPSGASTGGYNIDFSTWRDIVPDQVGARIRAERVNNYIPNSALIQSMDLAFYTSLGYDQSQLTEKLRITSNGNIGIGTSSPDAKLAVNGTIHTKEVKVDLNGWSDYVFKPSYALRSLAEVKVFIDKNHHLPEVPSEADVAENGVNLGEMNKVLLKKIEELTLYLLRQQRQIDELNKKVKVLSQ